MSLNTLYGINGVGKDTVALEVKRRSTEDITITSMSRLCMYLLGITENFDAQQKVDTKAYKKLESVPQSEMIDLEEGECRQFIEGVASASGRVLMLSHLVFALHLGREKVDYLTDRHIPEWYVKSNDSLVQLSAPSSEVMKRRRVDAGDLLNARERPLVINQIDEHQSLCDAEWKRIGRLQSVLPNGMHTVENIDLAATANRVHEIFYEQ